LRQRSAELGFAACRIATADPVPIDRLEAWLDEGHHGGMRYMARAPRDRCDPSSLLPDAKSVICCALVYGEDGLRSLKSPKSVGTSPVARFARGDDYHVVMRSKLAGLADELCRILPEASAKCCVDTSPLLEKALAERAGLGWIGKNCLLINPEFGSWFVLGEIVTDAELEPDEPIENRCGDCRLCIEGCPTGALDGRMLDARQCISYLTIENRHVPGAEYGCDLCQEVCPFNWNSPKDVR
jgi:epoxyqueuosine reductase